jgi:phosphotransferase system HPr (HPr) family protein
MLATELDVRNPSGLHARPASALVRCAGTVRARVRIANLARPELEVDAKSILGVLSLGVSAGGRIRVTADGDDEADAIDRIRELVAGGLGEAVAQ